MVCGGKSLLKMPRRNRFGAELKILDVPRGELTLDDTMSVSVYFLAKGYNCV